MYCSRRSETHFRTFFCLPMENPLCLPIRSAAVPGPHDVGGGTTRCQCLVVACAGCGAARRVHVPAGRAMRSTPSPHLLSAASPRALRRLAAPRPLALTTPILTSTLPCSCMRHLILANFISRRNWDYWFHLVFPKLQGFYFFHLFFVIEYSIFELFGQINLELVNKHWEKETSYDKDTRYRTGTYSR